MEVLMALRAERRLEEGMKSTEERLIEVKGFFSVLGVSRSRGRGQTGSSVFKPTQGDRQRQCYTYPFVCMRCMNVPLP